MGETGGTYLVGPDKLMRSDSYLDPVNHSASVSFAKARTGSVDTIATEAAFAHETDARIIDDYTGTRVLSASSPVDAHDTTWAIIAEMNEVEVTAAVKTLVLFIIVSGVFIVTVAIVAALLFSRRISQPIIKLVAGTDRLAMGDINPTGVKETEIAKINARSPISSSINATRPKPRGRSRPRISTCESPLRRSRMRSARRSRRW